MQLKVARVSAVLTPTGNSFLHCGTRTDSNHDWAVEVRRGGDTRHPAVAERRGLEGLLGTAWKASSNVLNLMRTMTGIYWREVSRGVTWKCLGRLKIR